MMKRIVVLEQRGAGPARAAAEDAREPGGARSFERLLDEVEQSAGELPAAGGRKARIRSKPSASVISACSSRRAGIASRPPAILGVSYKTLLQKIRECGLEM